MGRNDYTQYNVSRDDNTILTEDISQETNLFVRLKKYIICLRRTKDTELFKEYRSFLYKNIEVFLKELGLRELSSQIDTFVDFGDSLERATALGMSNYLFQEKMFLTTGAVYSLKDKRDNHPITNGIVPDFNSIRLRYDDALIVFLHRMSSIYSGSKILYSIWVKILNILSKEPKSSLYLVLNNMSDTMKKDYTPLIEELLSEGSFNKQSIAQIDKIKDHSYYLDRSKVLYVVCCGESSRYKEDGTTVYRCLNFLEGLNSRNSISADIKHISEVSLEDCSNYNYFIFQRPVYTDKLISFLKNLENLNKAYFAEYDDLIFDLKSIEHTPAYNNELYRKGYVSLTQNRQKALMLFNKFIVSTLPLSNKIKEINPLSDVLVLPNCVPRTWLEKVSQYKKSVAEPYRYLGYFSGSPTHNKDFKMIVKPLKKIMKHFPDVRLLVVGTVDTSDIDPEKVLTLSKVPYLDMIPLIQKCVATIAPLEANPFTECKSAVKFIEAITNKVPCIASPIHDMNTKDKVGCITCAENNWYKTLEKYLSEGSLLVNSLKKYEKNKHTLEVHYHLDSLISFLKKKNYPNKKVLAISSDKLTPCKIPKTNMSLFFVQDLEGIAVGEMFGNKKVRQEFVCNKDNLSRIDLKIATYQRKNKGILRLSLYDTCNPNDLIYSKDFDNSTLADNSWISFSFDKIKNSKGKNLILSVSGVNTRVGEAPTCYYSPSGNFGKLFINRTQFVGTLNFKLYSS